MSYHAKFLLPLAATAALVLALPSNASAQLSRRTTGITLRGTAWGLPNGQQRLAWGSTDRHTYFDGEGLGGWISFISRASDQVFIELSLGGVVRTVEEVQHAAGTDTYVEALVPLLVGARYFPLESRRSNPLRPYLSFGAGPYWAADITTVDRPSDDDVTVDSQHEFGGYLGAGMDFMFTDWIGLNFDVKRHYVDFPGRDEYSGFEYGMGLQFMWGSQRRSRRH
ncbi:MAG TPA: outer membrane beta-barrel protein [Longimicrobiales bacterium]|nr:outer membrane beta-barrel protein [Longimicrobiales bacterium]